MQTPRRELLAGCSTPRPRTTKVMSLSLVAPTATALLAPLPARTASFRASPVMELATEADASVASWYDAGVRLTSESVAGVIVPTGAVAAAPAAPEPAATSIAAEPAAPAPVASSTAEPSYNSPPPEAKWNPLWVTALPLGPLGSLDLNEVFVPEYLKVAPAWIDGSLPADCKRRRGSNGQNVCLRSGVHGCDPLCLAALAKPAPDMLKTCLTPTDRNAAMLALTPAAQQKKVVWMREAEVKHARLAMLAAAGWPLAELANGPWLKA
eukprot:7285828-Prymnesium_polylepis.1